jgi:hypothetical protein
MEAESLKSNEVSVDNDGIYASLITLLDRLDQGVLDASVIQWGCPVPSFGDLATSQVATLGINPSNREFVDEAGQELEGDQRRFHTLTSLGLDSWADADARHLSLIVETCRSYFSGNPYNMWFRKLDFVIGGARASFFDNSQLACHLDLVPYATTRKWSQLAGYERSSLLEATRGILGLLLRMSPIRILVLNGSSVVQQFQETARIHLERQEMRSWSLVRRSQRRVVGIGYWGFMDTLNGIKLDHEILVLGFNHNLQSGFGISNNVIRSIREWLAGVSEAVFK